MRKTNKSILLIFALMIAVIISLSAVSAEDMAIDDGDIASVDDSISEVSSEDLSSVDASPEETVDADSDLSTNTDDSVLKDGDSSSWYVDSKVETTGDGSQENPYKTIREAFDASGGNGTIYLASGIYNTTDDRGLRLNAGGNLSIIGAGSDQTVIDMLSQSTSFINTMTGSSFYLSNIKLINPSNTAINGVNLTIENSVFANGYYYSGAPILSIGAGDNIIRDCVFENSSSGRWNGAGVAIFNSNSNTLFENCLFKNNTNSGGGSVFYTSYCTPNLTINNCNITECPQAIYGEFANLVINNSYFYNNDLNKTSNSNKYAGCFYVQQGNITIDSSKFENNTGGAYAIMSTQSSAYTVNMTIVNSEFNNNFVGNNRHSDSCIGFTPRSGGNLYLNNNTGLFGNHSFVSVGVANITSDINLCVLDNTTYDLNSVQINIIGTLTDDMGNPINMTGFNLYFNDTLVGSNLLFKSGVNNYTFKEQLSGTYLVNYVYNSTNNFTNLNVKTSVISVTPLENIDLYVATDGSDETGDGTEENPFASIEKALDVAATALNANVYIKPGTYNYRTFKNIDTATGVLNILAIDGDVTVDMGGESRFCNVSNRSNVLIKGIYFINGYQSSGVNEDWGIINSHGNLTVKECKFANNSGYQSTIFGDSVIDSCIFESNSYNKIELYEVRTVINSTFYGAEGGRSAISFYDNYQHPYNLTVENCKFYDNTGVYSSGNATIKSSEFLNLTKYAIETQGGTLSVDDCTFKDISNSAIYLGYGTKIANISNSKLINVTYQYPINAYYANELYLENNTVSDIVNPYVFVDRDAYVKSPTTILILNNETIEQESYGANLKAKILDDNGNALALRTFTFEFDGKNITGSLAYDEMVAKSMGIYDGTYLVSGSSTNLLDATVKTGVLVITPLMNKDLYVSTTGSDETGDGTEANPFATLRKAMDEAIAYNNTIHVADGVYSIDTALEVDTNTAIVNIVGSGDNTIFDMGNAINFINTLSASSTVELKDLTLANAKSPARAKGGFITTSGNLTINNVKFINSTANNGAAIRNNGNLIVFGSYFENNTASSNGGAIWSNGGTNYVINCIFNKTSGNNGGAIYSSSYLYIKNNTFIDTGVSTATPIYVQGILEGGVILTVMDNETWDISTPSVTFNATVTDENNVPIYVSGISVSFYLDGIKLVSASMNGDVITTTTNIKLNGAHVLSATLGTAEDIIVKTATLNFVNPDVLHDVYVSSEGNDDTGDGTQANPYASFTKALSVVESMNGVIHVMTNMTSSQLNSITNLYNLTIIGEGSDIYIKDITTAFINIQSGSLNIVNLKFTNGSYPTYLLYNAVGTSLTLVNCSYENNVFQNNHNYYGAFVMSAGDELTLINCKAINNVFNGSSFDTGKLISSTAKTILENCTFANNTYTNQNGVLGGSLIRFYDTDKYVNGRYVYFYNTQSLENCVFENNTGILINIASQSAFDNCSFKNNNGSLISIASYNITEINDSTFESNNGNYLISGSGNFTIANNNITSNNVTGNLISLSGRGANIHDNIIKENNADTFVYASGTALVNIHDNTLDLGDMTYVNLTGNSKITGSEFTLTVNDNGTYDIEGFNLVFNATLVDADGNVIYGPMVYFTLNGDDIISANLVPVATASTKFGGEGEFIASAYTNAIYDPEELTTKTSVFNIAQISEKIIYVDILGNDETGNGSEENPYLTLERAMQDAVALNTIIYIQPGEYENMTLGGKYVLADKQTLRIIGLANEVDKVIIKNLEQTFADVEFISGRDSDVAFELANIEFIDSTVPQKFIVVDYTDVVKFENITFSNISANYLLNNFNANVTLSNVIIDSCSGNIFATNFPNEDTSYLGVFNSVINNSKTSIYGQGFVEFENSTMSNNNNSGITQSSRIDVTNSIFENNVCTYLFSASNVSLSNSVITSNEAGLLVYPRGGGDCIIDGNWWGYNITEADLRPYIMSVSLNNWIVAEVTANNDNIKIGDDVQFDLVLKLNDGTELTDILPTRIVKAIADNTAFDPESVEVVNNAATITGTVSGTGDITISIDNQDFVFDVKGYNAYITVDNVAIKLGETATVTVTFTDDNGPLSNKGLAVKVNGEESTVTTDADGKATITLADLAKGNHIVEVNFAGDNMHDPVTGAGLVMVSDAVLTVDIPEVSYGESPTINVELKDSEGNPLSGLVTVNINGKDYNVLVKDGEGSLAVPDKFDAGEYTVSAKLIGDSITESTATFVVDKVASVMTVTVADITHGEPFVINLDIADKTISGLSIVTINGVDYAIEIVNGAASKVINAILAGGSYDVTAKFLGDNYDIADAVDSFTVGPAGDTQLDVVVNDHSLDISLADADGNAISGAVNLTIDDEKTEVAIVKGKASVPIASGEHNVSVVYLGDANNAPASINKTVTVAENIIDTNVLITVNDIKYGESETVKITVTDVEGNPVSGILKVTVGEQERNITITAGEASVKFDNLTAGNYVAIANYIGDDTHAPSNGFAGFRVEKLATNIEYKDMNTTAVSPLDPKTGEWFTWRLVDGNGNPIANTPMKIGFNGVVYDEKNGIVTDENGYAKLQINLGYKGDYTFAISFLGDDNYNASFVVAKIKVATQTGTLTVPNKSYAASAKTKALTATFKTKSGKVIANKKVSFTVNGKTYTAKTNAKGVATVNVSLNKKGTYNFTAKYAGDSTYSEMSKTAKLTIK